MKHEEKYKHLEIWREKTKYFEDRSRRKMSKHQEFQKGQRNLLRKENN